MRFSKTAPLPTISVFLSLMVACLVTSVYHTELNGASNRIDYETSATSSISNDHKQSVRTSIRQFGSLDKRARGQRLTLMSFEPGELLIPLQTAAEVLQAFYTNIMIGSIGEWSRMTPRIWIKITLGTLQLLMTASEGTTVQWDFVASFALEMLRLTERGYTGMYAALFVDPTVGNHVGVSLYQCAVNPPTDPAAARAPAKVTSCLNPQAQAWFPKEKPSR